MRIFGPRHHFEDQFEEYYTRVEKEVYRDAAVTQHYKETELRVRITVTAFHAWICSVYIDW